MKLLNIQKETDANKQRYWGWFADINANQATILLDFAKDAFQQEARRGEQIDTKGNWLLAASFAGMSLAATVARPATEGLGGCFHLVIAVGVTIVIVSLGLAMTAVLWAIKVNRSWFPPNPELVLRPEIITDDAIDLERDLALHYIDNASLNRRVDDNKARLLKRGQLLLFVAIVVAAIVGLSRMLV
jgi:hypothetical protein